MTLHIVRGLPGTGKSTFVQKKFGGMLQIENDQVWISSNGKYIYIDEPNSRQVVKDYVKHMVMAAMQKHVNLAVSRVNMSYDSVAELVDLAKSSNYDFKIWRMDESNQEFFHNVHDVPDKAMEFMKKHFVKTLPWKQIVVKTIPCADGYTYLFKEIRGRILHKKGEALS